MCRCRSASSSFSYCRSAVCQGRVLFRPHLSLPPARVAPFLSGRRRHCRSAGVGAALSPRRPRSLWPRPPWVFLLKVTTSLFKNSAEKEKTLYPTLWAVIPREYRAGGTDGRGPRGGPPNMADAAWGAAGGAGGGRGLPRPAALPSPSLPWCTATSGRGPGPAGALTTTRGFRNRAMNGAGRARRPQLTAGRVASAPGQRGPAGWGVWEPCGPFWKPRATAPPCGAPDWARSPSLTRSLPGPRLLTEAACSYAASPGPREKGQPKG